MAVKKRQKLNIYLFRHGETYYNKKGIFTGRKDVKLSSLGLKQAKKIAKELKNKKIDIAFQTSLSRSKDTLKEVLKYHPECKKIVTNDLMIERSYGDLEGTYHADFIKKAGNQKINLLTQGNYFENFSLHLKKKIGNFLGKKEYDLIHRGYSIKPLKGESLEMVEKRVAKFIEKLKQMMKEEKINAAISAHGNSIRMFRKIMEKASIKKSSKWFIPYDKVYHYILNT